MNKDLQRDCLDYLLECMTKCSTQSDEYKQLINLSKQIIY